MEKREAAEAMMKIGPLRFIKGYNRLCRRCKILSDRAVKEKTTDKVFEKYCDRCKRMLRNIK